MTKIEEVARAQAEAIFGKGCPLDPDDYVRARAAIEAMREPTPAMVAATVPYVDRPDDTETTRLAEQALFLLEGPNFPESGHQDGLTSAKDVIRDYRSMISAALSEKE